MYVGSEQVNADNAVRDITALTPVAEATHAELQASMADVAYTMDNATNPSETSGMVFLVTEAPKLFLMEDLRRIRFIRFGNANGRLNVHYYR